MPSQFEKSLRTIELPAILQMLAEECASGGAAERALAVVPVIDAHEARFLQEETTAARVMMRVRGNPVFSGIRDVRSSVRRAEIGGMLNTTELTDIAGLLRSASENSAYGNSDRSESSVIDGYFYALHPNKYLENKIFTCIVGENEIADAASAALSDIRRHMRVAADKIRQQLNKIITSPAYQKALQEPIITIRNDRYVVPVKQEYRSSVPGLTHDVSGSGSTLFVEPMSVVQTNNEIRELLAKEKKEIERILAELSAEAASFGEDIISNYETLTALDLIFAKAKLAQKMDAQSPELLDDYLSSGRKPDIYMRRCRHPLIERGKVVPVDIILGNEFDTLVITGPNTGGKTVALKTIGLFAAMAQCGLHLPCESDARLPVFSRILADIGDEQSIEQSLSTFSSHMTNIVNILRDVSGEEDDYPGGTMLLLFDELGAGTDPVEGASLAVSIIEYARARGAYIAATTHYAELKLYALNTKGVENASCEFDVDTLKPTYRLLIGVPGKSNAFAISQRIGLPHSIIKHAEEGVSSETRSFEDAVGKLEQATREAENAREETARLKAAAERDARMAERYRAELERERENAAVKARRDATRIVETARGEIDAIFEELADLRRAAEEENDFKRLNEAKAEAYGKLNNAEQAVNARNSLSADNTEEEPKREIKPGDRVLLIKFGTEADVISVSGNSYELQAGIMKVTAKRKEIKLIGTAEEKALQQTVTVTRTTGSYSISPEIDVRGQSADDALVIVERYLDSARMAHLEEVRIIHGKGTGTLRAAIQQMLRREPGVKSFRLGKYGEGEIGVTVVTLKP